MQFPIRTAVGGLTASLLLCACSTTKLQRSADGAAPAEGRRSIAVVLNARAPRPGMAGEIALDPVQRAEVDRTIAVTPPAERDRLRYALPRGDDGTIHVVVYDGGGLPPDGRRPGRPHDYVVFPVLNSASREHYDPEQNALVPAIPPPAQRDM